ncbi:TonB-dependent receptor [Pedobacter miscanthi]|jgi:hypothetical protein|uniref:TonB-dependent receptor n=1 Tax=Pedobacter miscanthi TaxID=2259170 RepID=UPI00292E4B7E|nr:TonB-dependent receptor plug domain-containing protein [Pedobacter miscanthi]
MKQTYLILLFFVITASVSAQITDALNRNPADHKSDAGPKVSICAPSRAGIIANQPLYVVNNVTLSYPNAFEYIRPNDIEAINVLKGKQGTDKYGPSANNGVIEISLKNNVKLLNLAELLSSYKIRKKYHDLPVFIDEKRLDHRNDFYLSSDIVKDVEIAKIKYKSGKDRFIRVSLKPL